MNRRWIVVLLIFIGILISYMDRGSLGIAVPSIIHEFNITPARMGVLLSAFFWTYSLFQIPAGALVDRFGVRRAYAGGFLVWTLASASVALSRGAADIIGLRMVLGAAESTGPMASMSYIRSNFAAEDQGLPVSIYISGQNIGPALGALLGAILIDRFGWRVMFAATGLGALLWLPCWLAVIPPDGARSARVTKEAAVEFASFRVPVWSKLLCSRAFWAMSLCGFLASYYWFFVLTWVPGYLIFSRGFSTLEMGRVLGTALFTMAIVNASFGWVVDKWATRVGVLRARVRFAAAGYLGTGVILLLLVTPSRFWTLPVLTCAMCSMGIGFSSFWTIAQHVPPKTMVGRTVGYLNTVAVAAGALAPIVTGIIMGPQKHFGPAIFIAGMCPVLAAVCIVVAGSQGLTEAKALLAGTIVNEE